MYAKMIVEIEQKMQASLDNKQLSELHRVLESVFASFANGETSDNSQNHLDISCQYLI